MDKEHNIYADVVKGFGDEWSSYNQSHMSDDEKTNSFNGYFSIFPFDQLNENAQGFDMGCGSGRWADLVAPKVGKLTCIDPSDAALNVAKNNLKKHKNCDFVLGGVGSNLDLQLQDFGYCLGVLHHIPNTAKGIAKCASMLKPGAPFLLYLYYNFEDRSLLFKAVWALTVPFRWVISRLPFQLKKIVCYIIAATIYFPISRLACLPKKFGRSNDNWLLGYYAEKSFYFLCTDALDRFGTRIEKRFSKKQITQMLTDAGLENIKFSKSNPRWVCLAYKAQTNQR